MATSQKKWLRAVSFLALFFAIVGLGFVVKAEVNKNANLKVVKKNTTVKKRVDNPVTYYYTASSNSDPSIQNASNWSTNAPEGGCDGETYLCQVVYDGATYSSLANFLSATGSKAAIQSAAISTSEKD
ncbi:MAG: hypothetical protein ABIN91_19385 [Mucilaginibacter sp.]|uniref:hypothetical protein n=1 Tax=Mucilaginibacter sp. TaxID=1882438 RepID=UPI0032646847